MALKHNTSIFKYLIARDAKPQQGLYTWEWAAMIYLIATTVYTALCYKQLSDPTHMLLLRAKILTVTIALWGLYRIYPAPFTILFRATAQLFFLSWWYPDTYQLNNIRPNLDHIFAEIEQDTFHCQPAHLFSNIIDNPVFSEIMYLAYAVYFPVIAITALYYFFYRKQHFNKTLTIILAAFFIYYVIFIFIPVTGPQYYYLAIGEEKLTNAIFPNLNDYFHTHQQRMTAPGYQGFFYHIVEAAHQTGEKPTAAFPSSHIGITTILTILAFNTKNKPLIYIVTISLILMTFATVYIKAHYAIDVIAGYISAIIIYIILQQTLKIKT